MNTPVTPKYLQYLPNLDNVNEIFTFELLPIYSIETQYERRLKIELPKYLGINVFGWNFNQEGRFFIQDSYGFKRGYLSPNIEINNRKN